MEKKKTIAFDGDDVLIEHMKAFNAFHNHKYNTHFTFEDYMMFQIEVLWRISKEDFLLDEELFYESDFYRQIERTEGAYEVVDYLSQDNDLIVVTGRGINVEHHLHATLAQLYKPRHFSSIHHVGSAYNGNLLAHKWEKCQEHGAPLLIDDFSGHLIGAAQNGIHGILISKPWNKCIIDLPKCIDRARNLYEVLDIITRKEEIFWPET